MPNGTVKFFNATKGFGFITPDEDGKELFVPAASLVPAGLSGLKTGQRVSFEAKPDAKGPKAVNIVLLADVPPPRIASVAPPPAQPNEAKKRLVFYHNPANDASCDALSTLRAAGQDPRVVEYLVNPPTRDELKNLSLLMRGSDQSLVRKYDPLFLELCLDDRFISENELWGAIFEHPSLINGPIVATDTKARICKSANDVNAFLGIEAPRAAPPVSKQKELPERLLRLVTSEAPVASAAEEKPAEKPLAVKAKKIVVKAVAKKPVAKAKPKAKVAVKARAKPVTKAKPAAKKKAPVAVKKKRRA